MRHDSKRAVDSVLGHLQRILNTRQGSVPIGEDYGVPDFTDFAQVYPDGIRDLERGIRQTIQKYEPRLTAVRVRFVPSEEDILSVRFQISGKLITEDKQEPVKFESMINSEGKISIRR